MGLGGRMLLSYMSARVGAGARPQWSADELPRRRLPWRRVTGGSVAAPSPFQSSATMSTGDGPQDEGT
jgi:hypothetical protein